MKSITDREEGMKTKKDVLEKKLSDLREEVDSLDQLLLATLKTRFKIVSQIGLLKGKLGLPFYQKARWNSILEDRVKKAEKMKIKSDFTRSLLKLIHKESIRIQKEITKGRS